MSRELAKDKAILMAVFARIDPFALAVALGCVCGLTLFIATAVLLLKSTVTGNDPGTHLSLLHIYLPGYQVSWMGAFLGALYLWLAGSIAGFVLAKLWNLTHRLYVAIIVGRGLWWRMMAG